jgi:hypothetical protein
VQPIADYHMVDYRLSLIQLESANWLIWMNDIPSRKR